MYELGSRTGDNTFLVQISKRFFYMSLDGVGGTVWLNPIDNVELFDELEDIRRYQLPHERNIRAFLKRTYPDDK